MKTEYTVGKDREGNVGVIELVVLPDGRKVDEKLYRERFLWALDLRWGGCRNEMQPCRFCLRPAQKILPPGATESLPSECDGCWEVIHRLKSFLQEGGQIAAKALLDALEEAGACLDCGISGETCYCEYDE